MDEFDHGDKVKPTHQKLYRQLRARTGPSLHHDTVNDPDDIASVGRRSQFRQTSSVVETDHDDVANLAHLKHCQLLQLALPTRTLSFGQRQC